jgi:alanine racemase
LLLYGIAPSGLDGALHLRPVMTLRSRIVAVKGIRPGDGVGYGLRYVASASREIAVIPAGYADGLDTRLAGGGAVIIKGRRAPVVGSVCMDMLMIDVTGLDASPGDEVVFIGTQGAETMDVREVAATVGTIPYELLCRVGARIERVYDTRRVSARPRIRREP